MVDAEGRLFGRINAIDAAIGLFILILVPLAAGAVLLFRPPHPSITSVEPAPISMIEDRAASGTPLGGKVKVRGTGLRPVLRAEIGDRPAIAFIFESPSSADVLVGELAPGVYDLVLKDGVQEVARAHAAITIPEKPTGGTRVRAVGRFMELSKAAAERLRIGAKFPNDHEPEMEIVALGEPEPATYSINGNSEVAVPNVWHRAAVLAVRCQLPPLAPRECRIGGTLLDAGNVLALPGSGGSVRFLIDQIQPDSTPMQAEARVRFIGYPSVIDLLHVGDIDREQWSIDGRSARIISLGARRPTTGTVFIPAPPAANSARAELNATDQMVALDVVLRLGIDQLRDGWRYRTDLVRAGGVLTFTTMRYTVRGVILEINTERVDATNGGTR